MPTVEDVIFVGFLLAFGACLGWSAAVFLMKGILWIFEAIVDRCVK